VVAFGEAGDHDRREARQETAQTFDLRVQGLVATVRGGFSDLAWQPPEFNTAARQLIGFELFRDDTSTQPPSRLTWRAMPRDVFEARGLEIVPHGEYGVLAIWRRTTEAEPIAAIEYGPARLTRDLAGPAIVVPAEQRIHSLASLQRQGLITSEEMELAIDRLLGKAQPPIEDKPKAVISKAAASSATPATRRRLAFTYIAVAVVIVLVLVAAQQLIGRLLLSPRSATNLAASTPSAQPSTSPSPTPSAVVVNMRSILIKPTDLRAGYVAGPFSSQPICSACVPAVSSLSVVFRNTKLNRMILTAASIAPRTSDSTAVAAALMASVSDPRTWAMVKGLGDAASSTSVATQKTKIVYYVVWRTGAITNEIMLVGPRGTLTLQNAIDLAKIQQARVAKALR
jgi:hypothetical protein